MIQNALDKLAKQRAASTDSIIENAKNFGRRKPFVRAPYNEDEPPKSPTLPAKAANDATSVQSRRPR